MRPCLRSHPMHVSCLRTPIGMDNGIGVREHPSIPSKYGCFRPSPSVRCLCCSCKDNLETTVAREWDRVHLPCFPFEVCVFSILTSHMCVGMARQVEAFGPFETGSFVEIVVVFYRGTRMA